MAYSIQVKRLRNEDALDTLVVRSGKRKWTEEGAANHGSEGASENAQRVFRLARTYNAQQTGNHVLLENLERNETEGEEREYKAGGSAKRQRTTVDTPVAPAHTGTTSAAYSVSTDNEEGAQVEDERLPPEIEGLIGDYLADQKQAEDDADKETEDYVYDVYFSDETASGGVAQNSRAGYIVLNEDQEKLLFKSESSDDEDDLGEEEDSNAEDYYGNDYPDEVDDGEDEGDSLFGDSTYDSDGLGGRLGDLHLSPDEWSAEEGVNGESFTHDKYGWN